MRFRLPKGFADVPVVEDDKAKDAENSSPADTKEAQANDRDASTASDDDGSENFQHGVKAVRAMTENWTRKQLVVAYILIWIVCFVNAFSAGIIGTLTPYITSNFNGHSLTATTSIVANLMSGLIKLPYAKLMNVWGRPQAFAFVILIMTIGLIMMAACNSVTTYAAAQVFYSCGYSGIDFTTTIFIADTSSLKSRAFMIALASSPWLATTWAYGPAAQDILGGIGFRWGLGMWAIIYPAVTIPLCALFWYNQNKALKQGLVSNEKSGRTLSQSIVHYIKEFDVIGILLAATGLALFLLAFALYSYQKDQWKSPMIICFIIFGSLIIVAFTLWEKYFAPITFIPWHLIANRTVFFTYAMVVSIYCAWYIWDSYFYSLLIVVFRQSVTHATYIGNTYTVGATVCALIMGVIIRFNGHLKWQALYFGVPLTLLGVGLMIHFRQPGMDIGYIVMTQVFIAFGGGILVICEQMTVMAVSAHQNIPEVLAMEGMMSSIGGSIGLTIAAAMWTGIFPEKLMKNLPASAMDNFANIYGDLTVQSSYPVGSETRTAIDKSYGETQRLMLITAFCVYALALFFVAMWKSINVKKIKQVKGVVW